MSKKNREQKAAARAASRNAKKELINKIKKDAEKEAGVEEVKAETVEGTEQTPAPAPEIKPEPKPEPKPEQKSETKPEPKPEQKSKPKKEDPAPTVKIPGTTGTTSANTITHGKAIAKGFAATAMNALANGDRISANQSILLMKMIQDNYIANSDTPIELRDAYKQTFDAMMLRNVIHWMTQTKLELSDVGLKVNKELFDNISEGLSTYYGIETKLIGKTDDGQMMIDFETPTEVVQEVKESLKDEKKDEPLPVYNEKMSNDEVISSLKTILAARNGMEGNLFNAVEFARKAYSLPKAPIAEVVAAIMSHLPDSGDVPGRQSNMLLNGFGRMCFSSTVTNNVPFTGHAVLKQKLSKVMSVSDTDVAQLFRLFFALGAELNRTSINKTKEPKIEAVEYLKPWNNLLKAMNDKFINEMIETKKDKTKFAELGKIEGLMGDNNLTSADCAKILAQVSKAYGTALNDKQLKQILQKLVTEYQKEDINPLDVYIEKAYKK